MWTVLFCAINAKHSYKSAAAAGFICQAQRELDALRGAHFQGALNKPTNAATLCNTSVSPVSHRNSGISGVSNAESIPVKFLISPRRAFLYKLPSADNPPIAPFAHCCVRMYLL